MSGTIVERRDQVFTTFFSLRVFSASTLSRRWPSTNGPFFNERAIASLFLHSPQAAPLGPPYFLESPNRPGNAMRPRAEWAHKPRALCVRNSFDDHRPARLAQLVEHGLRGDYRYLHYRTRRFRELPHCALGRALDRPAAPSR